MKPTSFHKTLLPLSLLTATLLLPSLGRGQEVDSPDNIIKNGGFEEWRIVEEKELAERRGREFQFPVLEENLAPDHFNPVCELAGDPPSVTVVRDAQEKHSGEYSVKITNADGAQKGSVYTKEMPIQPNTKYKFSVWYKMADVDGNGVCFWVSHGPKQDFWSARKVSHHQPPEVKGSSEWVQYEFEFDTLADSENAVFCLQLQNALGTVWFDDFTITPIGEASKEVPNF